MSRFKRCMSFCTAVMMAVVFTASMCSCSLQEFFTGEKKEDGGDSAVNMSSDGEISKGEWLDMVNEAFGIQADESKDDIENAKEWGLIKADEEIDPNSKIDKEFAARTLMMAGGFVDENATDEEIMQAAQENGIISGSGDIDPQTAAESLNEAHHQWANQTFDYHENIQYQKGVQDFSQVPEAKSIDLVETENKVIMPNNCANSIQKDTVFILPPDENNKDGLAMKALNVIDNGDGTSTIISCPATLEEVYQDLEISGAFSPNIDEIEILDENAKITNGSIQDVCEKSNEPYEIRQLGAIGYDEEPEIQQLASLPEFTIEYPLKPSDENSHSEITLYATFSDIQVNADVDLDLHLLKAPDFDAYVSLNYKETFGIRGGLSGEGEQEFRDAYQGLSDADMAAAMNGEAYEAEQEIARVPIQLCAGVSIDFVVSFVVTANGYISFEISYQHNKGFEMHNSRIQTINETTGGDPVLKLSGSLAFLFSFSLRLQLALVKDSLIKIDLRLGPAFDGELAFYSDMACIDIGMYFSATLSLSFHKIIQELLNDPQLSITLCGKDNKDLSGSFHCEIRDGGIHTVDECTHGKDTTTTVPATTQAIPEGKLELATSYFSMPAGTSILLSVKSIPSDVSVDELVWSSSNTSKLKVDGNGNVTALSEGSAIITVKSKDGKHTFSCTVTITKGNAQGVSYRPIIKTAADPVAA